MSMHRHIKSVFATAAVVALVAVCGLVPRPAAAELPFRDGEVIRLIVPYGPGGGFDRIMRVIQPHLEKALNDMDSSKKVSVIVENRKGAGGRVAYEYTYASPPDGTRIVLMGDQGAALQQVALDAQFDLEKFTYLALVNSSDWGILVRKDAGLDTMSAIIARAQAQPILFGSSGAGSGDHIASVLVQAMLEQAGSTMPITHVHFGSSGKVRASMQRGESEAYIGSVESVIQAVEDGYGHMAVVFARERSKYYPDTPTIFEQKIPAAQEISEAIGISRVLVAPPGLPEDRANALSAALRTALTSKELLEAAETAKLPVNYGDGAAARAAVKAHGAALLKFKDKVRDTVAAGK